MASRAGQGKARQGKTRQGNARPGKTKQRNARQSLVCLSVCLSVRLAVCCLSVTPAPYPTSPTTTPTDLHTPLGVLDTACGRISRTPAPYPIPPKPLPLWRPFGILYGRTQGDRGQRTQNHMTKMAWMGFPIRGRGGVNPSPGVLSCRKTGQRAKSGNLNHLSPRGLVGY